MAGELMDTLSGGLNPGEESTMPAGSPDFSQHDSQQNAISGGANALQMLDYLKKDFASGQSTYKMDSQGKVEIETTADNLKTIMGMLKNYAQVAQSHMEETQKRIQQVQANPLMNVLTQVAGQMAQQKNMPGIVQALGRSSLALNPTVQQLQGQEMEQQKGLMEVLGEQAQVAGEIDTLQHRDVQEGMARSAAQLAQERENRLRINEVTTHLTGIATRGDKIDPKLAEQMYTQAGATPEQARTSAQIISTAAQEASDRKAADELAKEKKTADEIASRERIAEKHTQAMLKAVMEKAEEKKKPGSLPLEDKASMWQNVQGDNPDPDMTRDEAQKAGFFPTTTTQQTKLSGGRTALESIAQIRSLIPDLAKKGFAPVKPGIFSKLMADAEKGIFPNDETLRTVIMHAASMVTIARSTGDLGRAQSAYKSFQDIVEHPSTPKAMNMMMDQLEKQIKSSVPQLKEYKTTTGSTQDANSPKGVSRETIKAAVEKAPRDGKRYEIKPKDGQVFYVKDGKVVP